MRLAKRGDRVRMKVRTMSGWKGFGTVTMDQIHKDQTIHFVKDGYDGDDSFGGCEAMRHEIAICRKEKSQ